MADPARSARTPWHGLRALALPLLLLALSEAGARRALSQGSELLAPPSAALQALLNAALDGSLWSATGFTLGSAALGLLLGAGLATLAGIGLGLSPRASRVSWLGIELLRPVPALALLPLSMMVFGFGLRLELSLVAFGTFWPQLLLVQAAVRQVRPQQLELSRLLGLSRTQRLFKIVLPACLPRLFTALRLCTVFALQIAVTVEIGGNPQGMGYALLVAQQTLAPGLMLGWIAWIGLIGLLINTALLRLQRALDRRMGALP